MGFGLGLLCLGCYYYVLLVRFRTKDGNFSFFGVELALFALFQAQVPSRAKRVADATCGC